jgi:hypothetical protein
VPTNKVLDPPIFISISSKNYELDAYLEKTKADDRSFVFITAYDPGSKVRSDAINTTKQAELLSHIRQMGCSHLPGEGSSAKSPFGVIPPRPNCWNIVISNQSKNSNQ